MPRTSSKQRGRGTLSENSEEEDVTIDNGDNVVGDSRNPLLIPVILSRLFEVCSLSDLPRFRLVSKEWYSLSLTRFRKEMTVVIRPPKSVQPRRGEEELDKNKNGLDWDKLESKLDVGEKPFRNFRLCRMEFDDLSYDSQYFAVNSMRRNMSSFFCKYGASIHKLELWRPHVRLMSLLRKAIIEETPNLEKLTLSSICHRSGFVRGEEYEMKMRSQLKHLVLRSTLLDDENMSLDLIFPHFPNIQKVEVALEFYNSRMDERLKAISQHLSTKKNAEFVLSELIFRPRDRVCTLGALRLLELKLPLLTIQKIMIQVEYMTCGDVLLRKFISTAFGHYGPTLTEFGLAVLVPNTLFSNDNLPFRPGPCHSLTTLDLRGKFSKNLHFLRQFPNLEVLKISNCDDKILNETDAATMRGIIFEKVRMFHFSSASIIEDRAMTLFVELMPNVEDFYGPLADSTLTIICDKWGKLKKLKIGSPGYEPHSPRLSDEGITGIVEGSDGRFPNITDLQDLEWLSICRQERMSDQSIWNGFLKLPRLQNLFVQLSEKTSGEAFLALVHKFPGDTIRKCVPAVPPGFAKKLAMFKKRRLPNS